MNDTEENVQNGDGGTLADSELEQPSTENEPGEEPKGGTNQEAEAAPDHEAVGIGVIGGPQTDTEDTPAG